jgi:carboxyl-terminal processing protease
MRRPLAFVFLAATLTASAQPASRDREGVITRLETRSLATWHYAPQEFNDSLSRRVFDLYLKRLDPQKRFLLKADVDSLARHRDRLDDQLLAGDYGFAETAGKLLNKRVEDARVLVGELLKQDLRLDEPDSMESDAEKTGYSVDAAAMRQRWTRLLKFQILSRLDGKRQESAAKDTVHAAGAVRHDPSFPDTAALREAKAYVERNFQRSFTRMVREEKLDRVSLYLGTVANVFDPHTEYFKPQAREEFNMAMTGTLEGIGASLREEDGYIKVVAIIPGSASWRQKQLKAEDKILKVAQAGEEPVDLAEASVNEAVRLIRGKKGTEVRLTVQKPDGQVKVIAIVRDVVVLEESYAKSAILTTPESPLKVGYITLPSFYHDFQNPKGRNSAADVRRELERLKAQGAEAIVLDLRNNGGGSLDDAVKMSGLFLPWGPMVQVKDRQGGGDVLEDIDPGVAFDGPVAVLVNTFSASASEILAAALQDYGRAVIFGTDTTFGKGTVQTVLDLDNMVPSAETGLKPLGSLKLTVQKFYRVNGGSTQFKGVVPEILIPDAYTNLDVGEQSLDYPLPWDAATPLRIQRWFDAPPIPALQAKSRARVAESPYFKRLTTSLKRQESQRNQKALTLTMGRFFAERDKSRHESDSLDVLQKQSSGLVAAPLASQNAAFAADSAEQEKVNDWKQSLTRDYYLREAVHVLEDWSKATAKDKK